MTPTRTIPASVSTRPCRVDLLKSRVESEVRSAGRTVVGAVARLSSGLVASGKTLVSISLDVVPEANLRVHVSPLIESELRMSAVPSARQKARVSSDSTRLHWGQRFISKTIALKATLSRYSAIPTRCSKAFHRGSLFNDSIKGSSLKNARNTLRSLKAFSSQAKALSLAPRPA